MKVPHEFEQFARGLYPGSADEYPTAEEWIAESLHAAKPRQRAILKRFLDELLDGEHTDAELQGVWDGTSPSYQFVEKNGARVFLTVVRGMIPSGR